MLRREGALIRAVGEGDDGTALAASDGDDAHVGERGHAAAHTIVGQTGIAGDGLERHHGGAGGDGDAVPRVAAVVGISAQTVVNQLECCVVHEIG